MEGDAQVPLLRIVPVAGRDGEMVARAFDHIQYCPLAQRRFQDIQRLLQWTDDHLRYVSNP
jgi:hypothetical protein